MNKRTWRFRALGIDVGAVMASAPSYEAAAKACGVNKSTIFRWVKSGRVPAPGRPAPAAASSVPLVSEGWAAAMRAAYVFNATEDTYIDLADEALTMARDRSMKPADRLAAMGRFSALVRQINFEVPDGDIKTTPDTRTRPWPRRVS